MKTFPDILPTAMPSVFSRMDVSHCVVEAKWWSEHEFSELTEEDQDKQAQEATRKMLRKCPMVEHLICKLTSSTKTKKQRAEAYHQAYESFVDMMWPEQKKAMLAYDTLFESPRKRQEMDNIMARRNALASLGVRRKTCDRLFDARTAQMVWEVMDEFDCVRGDLGNPSTWSLVVVCESCQMEVPRDQVKRCSACREPVYCSTACQKDHWPTHRQQCSHRKPNKSETQKKPGMKAMPRTPTNTTGTTKEGPDALSPIPKPAEMVQESSATDWAALPVYVSEYDSQ